MPGPPMTCQYCNNRFQSTQMHHGPGSVIKMIRCRIDEDCPRCGTRVEAHFTDVFRVDDRGIWRGSAWRSRLTRAASHLNELKLEVNDYLAATPMYAERVNKSDPASPQTHRMQWFGRVASPVPDQLIEAAGDVASDLRSSLDRIVYALAEAGGATASELKKTEFVVAQKPADFTDLATKKLPRIDQGAIDAIKALQPYHAANPSASPLQILHDLRRINFHRRAHLTAATGHLVGMEIQDQRDTHITVRLEVAHDQPYQDGDLLHEIEIQETGPDPVCELDLTMVFELAFAPGDPATGQPVVSTLEALYDYVDQTVLPPLEAIL